MPVYWAGESRIQHNNNNSVLENGFTVIECVLKSKGFIHLKFNYYFLHSIFGTYRTSVVLSSNSWKTLTYDTLRGNNGMNIATGKFVAPDSGDWEFFFQGMDVSLFQ